MVRRGHDVSVPPVPQRRLADAHAMALLDLSAAGRHPRVCWGGACPARMVPLQAPVAVLAAHSRGGAQQIIAGTVDGELFMLGPP